MPVKVVQGKKREKKAGKILNNLKDENQSLLCMPLETQLTLADSY